MYLIVHQRAVELSLGKIIEEEDKAALKLHSLHIKLVEEMRREKKLHGGTSTSDKGDAVKWQV